MAQLKKTYIYILIIVSYFEVRGADKYTDENRPYEFGFSIDGEQHRHEKKDENGIIMGEFGFITADGVYHVTVYATDENGNFKILSMKNIRVKPYPTTAVGNDVRTGHSLSLPPQNSVSNPVKSRLASASQSQAPFSSTPTSSQQDQELSNNKPSSPKSIIESPRACSHCSIPTTTTARPVYSQENVSDISLNTQNGFRSTGDSNSRLNNANAAQHRAIVQSPNNKELQPQSNQFNIGNSPANYEKGSSINTNFGLSNSKPTSSDDAQNYNTPMTYSGINQYQPINNGNNGEQTVNQNPVGSIPSQSNQFNIGNSPANYEKGSSINTNFGSSNSNPTSSDDAQNYNTPMSYSGITQYQPINNGNNGEQNVYQNPVGSIPSQQSNPQQFNPYQNSGNNNLKQQFGSEPNTYLNNLGINNDGNEYGIRNKDGNNYSQTAPQNTFDKQGSEHDSNNLQGERNPKQLGTSRQTPIVRNEQNAAGNFRESDSGKLEKPVLISAQMQIVDKNTDINYKKPGEVDGLPKGLTKGDMKNLLYTFNYTLAFQGHYEEGYTSGAKQGYYFVTGRNGIRTRIDYVADENGFRPKITQEVLDLLSDEVPKPETEKDEKYGLKGYEFKWLYFPVGSNQR